MNESASENPQVSSHLLFFLLSSPLLLLPLLLFSELLDGSGLNDSICGRGGCCITSVICHTSRTCFCFHEVEWSGVEGSTVHEVSSFQIYDELRDRAWKAEGEHVNVSQRFQFCKNNFLVCDSGSFGGWGFGILTYLRAHLARRGAVRGAEVISTTPGLLGLLQTEQKLKGLLSTISCRGRKLLIC